MVLLIIAFLIKSTTGVPVLQIELIFSTYS